MRITEPMVDCFGVLSRRAGCDGPVPLFAAPVFCKGRSIFYKYSLTGCLSLKTGHSYRAYPLN